MEKLFGTDGIRGKVNDYPMTLEIALKVGGAVASFFKGKNNKIVIAKDTRVSGDMIEAAICAGVTQAGLDVHTMGVLPTPALAFLTHYTKASAGIMISASHNPYCDNGIKIFNEKGFKLKDEEEKELENAILSSYVSKEEKTGKIYPIYDSEEPYLNFLKTSLSLPFDAFSNLKIVIDCANGSNSEIAPKLFNSLKANFITINNLPDGININEECGSEHTEKLKKRVLREKADIGFAFDGDGDRIVVIDDNGEQINGDSLIGIFAKFAKKEAKLKNNTVVTTVMSNLGLKKSLQDMQINYQTSDVGDRNVVKEMLKTGSNIGGENSGHIVFFDKHTTGDGLYAALKLLEIMAKYKKKVSELSKIVTILPQTLLNVEVDKKEDFTKIIEIKETIESVEKKIGKYGRVLVRNSGTQNICRVMVEAETKEETEKYCDEIGKIIKKYSELCT